MTSRVHGFLSLPYLKGSATTIFIVSSWIMPSTEIMAFQTMRLSGLSSKAQNKQHWHHSLTMLKKSNCCNQQYVKYTLTSE